MIEENPFFGYRTVACLLGFNKNTAHRIFQIKGRQAVRVKEVVACEAPGVSTAAVALANCLNANLVPAQCAESPVHAQS